MKVKMLGLYIRAMVALSLIFIGTGVSWAAKRYLVTIESPLTYQVFKQASQKKNGKSPALQMLAHSGARVEKMLDQVQMVVVNADSNKAVEDLKGQYGIADVEEEFFIPVPQSLPSIRSFALAAEKVSIPWGIEAVRAPEAWLGSHAGRDVRVLVLDTGIDKDHPDLASRFEKGKNFADVDLTDAPYDYFDNISHGTHVAGTIAADGKVSGLVGVAPEARILSARVCSSMGCSSISILDGINWGIQEKVDVMNLSLGGPIPSRAGEKAYKQAAAAGIVVVCASGNDGVNQVSYPGAYDSTIAVGAVDEDIVKADFSNWGSELDIMAPGVNVLSSVPQ
ncbi:MAG: S8 family serine peptidase, partial [Bdellovibrionales bacterium]|nr:S8 family serine peptidase [Bdellovibrionales bacterium]